jgi:hypothetical protein
MDGINLDKRLAQLSFTEFKRWLKGRSFRDKVDPEKLYKSIGGKVSKTKKEEGADS